ncbi:MAG: hypothetical protein WCB19_07425 [Thermoplasmata archaeon]
MSAKVPLRIRDKDGSGADLSGTVSRTLAWDLAKELTDGAKAYLASRSKLTLDGTPKGEPDL